MHKLKYLTLAGLLLTLAISPAFAKSGHSKSCENIDQQASRLEHLKKNLDLTSEQEAEIKDIFAGSKERNEAMRSEKRSTREEIRKISRAEALDESRLRELLRKQSDQQADMMIAMHATRVKIDQVLTPEQQKQHEALRQQKQEHRMSAKHRQEKD